MRKRVWTERTIYNLDTPDDRTHLRSGRHLMSLYEIPTERWQIDDINADRRDILAALESGRVLFCPALPFTVDSTQQRIFTPSILGGAKNASFDPRTQRLGSTTLSGGDADMLRELMR